MDVTFYKKGFENKLKDGAAILVDVFTNPYDIFTVRWNKENKLFFAFGNVPVKPIDIYMWSLPKGQSLSNILEKEVPKPLTAKQQEAKDKRDAKIAKVFETILNFKSDQAVFNKTKAKTRKNVINCLNRMKNGGEVYKFFDYHIQGGLLELFTTDSDEITTSDVKFTVAEFHKWIKEQDD